MRKRVELGGKSMYRGKRILAIIPARGGSKGIPKKNIVKIEGKPLIAYTIEAAKNSKYLDKIVVSTEDLQIKEIAEDYGGEVPFLRPKELGQDNSRTIDCVIHALEILKNRSKEYDYIVLLQCTNPLRESWHIDEAIEKIIDENKSSLVSVSKVEEHPIFMRTIDAEGSLRKILNSESDVRRQDLQEVYKINGAIYIQKLDSKFSEKTSFNDGELAYILENKFSVDIDGCLDIKKVEYYLKKRNTQN